MSLASLSLSCLYDESSVDVDEVEHSSGDLSQSNYDDSDASSPPITTIWAWTEILCRDLPLCCSFSLQRVGHLLRLQTSHHRRQNMCNLILSFEKELMEFWSPSWESLSSLHGLPWRSVRRSFMPKNRAVMHIKHHRTHRSSTNKKPWPKPRRSRQRNASENLGLEQRALI